MRIAAVVGGLSGGRVVIAFVVPAGGKPEEEEWCDEEQPCLHRFSLIDRGQWVKRVRGGGQSSMSNPHSSWR